MLALGRGQLVGAHLVVGQQNPLSPAPAARPRVARAAGDPVVDDVGVRLGAEAADHQHRNARRGEPAGQLLPKGVLLRRDVQGVLLALGAVSRNQPGISATNASAPSQAGGTGILPDSVDQVGKPAFPAGPGQLRRQPPVHRRRVRQRALGDQAVQPVAA